MLNICQAFRAAQIPCIPYKGPALGWLCYRNVARRTFDNLDFCIEQRYVPRAMEVLEGLGYHCHLDGNDDEAKSDPASGQYIFSSGQRRLVVKLCAERAFSDWPGRLDLVEMSRRLQTVVIGGQEISTFSLEDSLILSCAHGTRNFWDTFSWFADVSALITANTVDWEQAMRLAQEMKCRRMLLLGLCLAHEFVGAPVPDAVLGEAAQDPDVLWLLRQQRKQLAGKHGATTVGMARLLYRLKSQDGWREGLHYLFRKVNAPAETDSPAESDAGAFPSLRFLTRLGKQLWAYRNILRPSPELDLAGFLPMRREVVDHLLEFAGLKPGDVLYDLGCGDGRIVVAAAEKFGIRAVGVDLDPYRISQARRNARKHGVQDRVRFLLADAKKVDVSEATVVTLYMGMNGMLRLAPGLKQRLRPGTRIVSCDATIYGWPCDEQTEHKFAEGEVANLYMWRISSAPSSDAGTGKSLPLIGNRR
jgi:SAM-dependent methyltransferase